MVSVIIPIYNREDTLPRCVDSLLAQTYPETEIVLVDDGSTDRSPQMCDDYARAHDNIRAVHRENGGISAARNTGMQNMTGEYYTFVDADDYVDAQLIEKLVTAMERDGSDLVMCGHVIIKDGRRENRAPQAMTLSSQEEIVAFIASHYQDKYIPLTCTKLYKKSLTTVDFDKAASPGEDYNFNIVYFSQANKITMIPDALYYFYCISTGGSLTHVYKEGYYEGMRILYQTSASYLRNYDLSLVAYRFYKSAIAFLVKQIMMGYDRAKLMEYLKKICGDAVFQTAVSQVRVGSPAEKVLLAALKRKQYAVVLQLSRLRATQKTAQLKKLANTEA